MEETYPDMLNRWAQEMKDKYPYLNSFSREQVIEVWQSYSEQVCAGWLSSDDHKTIYKVFSQAPDYFKYKEDNPKEDGDYDNYAGDYFNWK